MVLNLEVAFAIAVCMTMVFTLLAFWIRVKFKGEVQFERVERHGGSPLLGKRLMTGGYWCFQSVARGLVHFRFTPNQISWTSLVFGVAGGVGLACEKFGSAALLLTLSSVMDALDGMVARMTGKSSAEGEILDASLDRYVEFAVFSGAAFLYRDEPLFLGLSLLALMGSFMVSYSSSKAEIFQVVPPRGAMRRPERMFYLVLGALVSALSSNDTAFRVVLGMVAVLANYSAVARLFVIWREVRDASR